LPPLGPRATAAGSFFFLAATGISPLYVSAHEVNRVRSRSRYKACATPKRGWRGPLHRPCRAERAAPDRPIDGWYPRVYWTVPIDGESARRQTRRCTQGAL
jgi:hypothetical protein